MVSTHLKNISQNGNLPQLGVKIKNTWNHHLVLYVTRYDWVWLWGFFDMQKAGSPNDLPPGNVLRRGFYAGGVWFWFFPGDFIDLFISWDPWQLFISWDPWQLVYLPTCRLICRVFFCTLRILTPSKVVMLEEPKKHPCIFNKFIHPKPPRGVQQLLLSDWNSQTLNVQGGPSPTSYKLGTITPLTGWNNPSYLFIRPFIRVTARAYNSIHN